MATKKVKVRQADPDEITKAQIVSKFGDGRILFAAHEKKEDRVRIPNGTSLEVLDAPITGAGIDNPTYYYITDNPVNGNFRRYFIKTEDVS